MNKDNAKDYLPLVQALADGKVIQVFACERGWRDEAFPSFSMPANDYRIKPESRELWEVYDKYGTRVIVAAPAGAEAYVKRRVAAGYPRQGYTFKKYKEVEE